jgi:hypothetical protein
VGSAYASLIYDIPIDASCQVLVGRCKGLWDALDMESNLSSKMRDCNDKLSEFQRVKDTLGDVQKNAYKLMEAINANGVYEVSSVDLRVHSIENVIRLKVKGETLGRRSFDLVTLRDLQSKLALIVGAESDSASIQKFLELLHMVQRIAELLVSLHMAGNTQYISFLMRFGCATVSSQELDSQISKMEEDREQWSEELKKNRRQYNYLNYFTSKQLLYLRRELGMLKENPTAHCSADLIALLQSVTQMPTPTGIQQALIKAQRTLHEDEINPFVPEQTEGERRMVLLTPDSLTPEQGVIFDKLQEDDYDACLILDAIAANKDDNADLGRPQQSMEERVRYWCSIHEHEYDGESAIPSLQAGGVELVDKNNPLVQQIITEGDYSEEIALKAVEMAGDNPEKARDMADFLETYDGDTNRAERLLHMAANSDWNLPSRYISQFTVTHGTGTEKYLELQELGEVLKEISYPALELEKKDILERRRTGIKFTTIDGQHNLIVVKKEEVWKAVLYLYMKDSSLPLPTFEEVLICTPTTTTEEVTLLWRRAVSDPEKKRIFCLVHAEKLSYQVCDEALRELDIITQGCPDYRLVIICASGEQERTHVTSRLSSYQRTLHLGVKERDIAEYLDNHLTTRLDTTLLLSQTIGGPERELVRCLQSCVRVVMSTCSGMGKTLFVQRIAAKLSALTHHSSTPVYVCIPINGPQVSSDQIVRYLMPHLQGPSAPLPQLLHFDISHMAVADVDSVLFSIIILGGLSDHHGKVWRRQKLQLCVVECTVSQLGSISEDDLSWHLKVSSYDCNPKECCCKFTFMLY